MKTAVKTAVIALVLLLAAGSASAVTITTIILSGSDTISFHDVTSEAAAAYNFLSNGGAGGVLVVNDFGAGAGYGGGGFGPFTSAAAVPADLSPFAGIMFASPGTCCSDPGAGGFGAATEAALAAFVAGGGNLYIEDYEAAPVWTGILGFDGSPGVIFSSGCTGDPGTPTAQGLLFGYVGGSFGCYTHQIYDPVFFAALGFVSLVDGCNGGSFGTCGPGTSADVFGSVILGSGAAAVGVPSPGTLMLLAGGLLGGALASGRRFRLRR
jgi:hypothetical protein